MHWHSAAEFFAMGGYAPYLWGSVGACAFGMLAETIALRRRRRQLLQALRERRELDLLAPRELRAPP